MSVKLPKTVSTTLHVILSDYGRTSIATGDMTEYGYTTLATHDITLDVPQDDPTPKFIEALESKAARIDAEARESVRVIMGQINDLKCLEYKPESGDV
jgi:hypothetical protein